MLVFERVVFAGSLGVVSLSLLGVVLFRKHRAARVQSVGDLLYQHLWSIVLLVGASCMFGVFGTDYELQCSFVPLFAATIAWPFVVLYTLLPTRRVIPAFSDAISIPFPEAVVLVSSAFLLAYMMLGASPYIAEDVCVTSMSFEVACIACACAHIAAAWCTTSEGRVARFPYASTKQTMVFLVVMSFLGMATVLHRFHRLMTDVDSDPYNEGTSAWLFSNGTVTVRHEWVFVPGQTKRLEVATICVFAVGACLLRSLVVFARIKNGTPVHVHTFAARRGNRAGAHGFMRPRVSARGFAEFMQSHYPRELDAYNAIWTRFHAFVLGQGTQATQGAGRHAGVNSDPLQSSALRGGCPWLGIEPRAGTDSHDGPCVPLGTLADSTTALLSVVSSMCNLADAQDSGHDGVGEGAYRAAHPMATVVSTLHRVLISAPYSIPSKRINDHDDHATAEKVSIFAGKPWSMVVQRGILSYMAFGGQDGSAWITDAMAFIAVVVATRYETTFYDFQRGQTATLRSQTSKGYEILSRAGMLVRPTTRPAQRRARRREEARSADATQYDVL